MDFKAFILSVCCLFIATNAERKLAFVQALWRHGDRAPLHLPYPLDKNTESHWQRGFGELTSIGMNQLHDLGKFFRKRYQGFVSENFVPSEAYMLASEVDRAIVSAQSFFYGMYPANGSYEFISDFNWQPLPVHSATPGSDDLLCHCTSVSCPYAESLYAADDAKSAEKYNKEYADMFSFLGPVTGISNFSFYDINGIFDITREVIHNMDQPSWVNKEWSSHGNQTTLEIATWMRNERFMNQYGSFVKGKAFAGFLLNTWIQNSLNVANGTEMPKFMWYSSHDTVQLALMYAMDIGNGIMPPYAAALIWEVYNNNGQFEVEVYYRNDTSSDVPASIAIPGCGTPCIVSKLPELYANATFSTADDMKRFCKATVYDCKPEGSSSSRLNPLIFLLILLSYVHV